MYSRTGMSALLILAMVTAGCVEEEPDGDGDRVGFTVILGGGAPDEGGYPQHPHCLHKVPLGSGDAEELYCPDQARWIDWAMPPLPGHDALLFIAEVDGHSGIYGQEFPIYEPWIQELYRLDLSSGELHLLGYYLADSYEGTEPVGAVHTAFTLEDGRTAVHWTIPEAHGGRGEELVVFEADGTRGDDLLEDRVDVRMLATDHRDRLMIRHTDPDGRLSLLALNPDVPMDSYPFAIPGDAPLAADVEDHQLHLFPDGECMLLEVEGAPTLACIGGSRQMAAATDGHLMGFAGDGLAGDTQGGVLLERDDVVWYWDGADGSDAIEIGVPEGADGVSWRAFTTPDGEQGAFFRAYVDGSDRDFPVWFRGGELLAGDTTVSSLQGESFALGTEGPIALFYDSDWESSTRNQVFACDPDGACSDILARHSLRGVLLPSGPIW